MDQVVRTGAVLVVEDEPMVRMVAVDALADSGLKPFEATDASEALGVLEQNPEIGLVFTDINMPGEMDGLALVEVIHKLWPKIELVVTSGRHRLSDSELPDDGTFLPKPYQPRQLVDLVRRKLSMSRDLA